MDRAVMVTGMVGAALIAAFLAYVGINSLLSMSYGETFAAEQGLGTLTAGFYVAQLAVTYLFSRCIAFRRAGKRIPWQILVVLVALVLVYNWNTFMGRRGPLLWLLASMALVAHMNRLYIKRAWFVVGIFAFAVYSFALEGMRANLGRDAGAQLAAARTRLASVENPMVVPELETVWNNLVIVVTEKPPLVDYPGESALVALEVLVPKPVWRSRPLGMAERFAWWYDPLLARSGGAYAFNATAEGYANLGMPGAAVEIALMTLLYFLPMAACMRRSRSSMAQTIAACIAAYAYNQYRGELASLLKISVTFGWAVLLSFVLRAIARSMVARTGQAGPPGTTTRRPVEAAPRTA
jgi:hypothetical protein